MTYFLIVCFVLIFSFFIYSLCYVANQAEKRAEKEFNDGIRAKWGKVVPRQAGRKASPKRRKSARKK